MFLLTIENPYILSIQILHPTAKLGLQLFRNVTQLLAAAGLATGCVRPLTLWRTQNLVRDANKVIYYV